MSAAMFLFAATVGEAEVAGSASALYTVTVRTNLAEYAEHAGPQEAVERPSDELDAELQDDDDELVTIAERTITVKRSYSAFRELRDALCKSRIAASASLPELPGKSLFAATAKDLALRRSAFASLLTYIGNNAELAAADATCAFLSEVPKPDFALIHQQAMAAVREMLEVAEWAPRYTSKSGVEIATHASPSSDVHMLRSTVLVPLPVDRVHAHYKARALAERVTHHTPNWARFTPDATFTHIEQVSETAGVMHVKYRVPVISLRDVVLYQAQLNRDELDGVTPPGSTAAAFAAVARSILHPHCPTRRNTVRARLLIAVTLFFDTGDGTKIVSFQHADPRGIIPASIVNKALVRGKEQLKEMRRVMIELG